MPKRTIAILGAGSWGTAVAIHLASSGSRVLLWGRSPNHVAEMVADRCNKRYLPQNSFPTNVYPVSQLKQCYEEASDIFLAIPSHGFREVLLDIKPHVQRISWLTKGIAGPNQLLSQLVTQELGTACPMAILSGPSFAREVADNLPTALTLACNDLAYQQHLQTLFHQGHIRIYPTTDLIGVQLCGTIKNILAIACGMSDGLHYGANTKAALITRGLAEMKRLGLVMGAQEETFIGLAGVGDLVLTCMDDQSRNRRFGLYLGRGVAPAKAEQEIGQVVEGARNAKQISQMAKDHQVDMPICSQVHAVLSGQCTVSQAAKNLMNRLPADKE